NKLIHRNKAMIFFMGSKGWAHNDVERNFDLFPGIIEYHAGGQLSHAPEVSGDGGQAVQYQLFQWCFIIGVDPHILPDHHTKRYNLFDQHYQVVLPDIYIYVTGADLLFLDVFYYFTGESVILANLLEAI